MRKRILRSLGVLMLLVLGVWGGRTLWRSYQLRPLAGPLEVSAGVSGTYAFGGFSLQIDAAGGRVTVEKGGAVYWQNLPEKGFVAAMRADIQIEESRGSFSWSKNNSKRFSRQTLDAVHGVEGNLYLSGLLQNGEKTLPYTCTLSTPDSIRLETRISLGVEPEGWQVYFRFASELTERFYGGGMQFTHFDLKGHRVPILVSEQGIGRGKQPLTTLVDFAADAGGDAFTSYAPVPQLISTRGRGIYLRNYAPNFLDLRQEEFVQLEVWSDTLSAVIHRANAPLELIQEYTQEIGRMRPLPDWTQRGLVLGMQGGTARVREMVGRLRAAGVPLAGIWLQDWVGQRTTSFGKQLWWNWELDKAHYPAWDSLVVDLRRDSIFVMTYFNPFFTDVSEKASYDRNLFAEAREAGYLIRREDGRAYLTQNTSFSAALLDLTDPAARSWMYTHMQNTVTRTGVRGWMADFGEALPFDAYLDRSEARTFHNRYPEHWAALNRALVDRFPGASNYVFFTRSGYRESPRYSTLFWLGDQTVSWDRYDGIKTAVTGLMSSGISGYSLNHSDIGGYTTLTEGPLDLRRSRELLLRWIELNAFTPFFRSHEGNRPGENVQLYDDSATLAHTARFAQIFAKLAPYRAILMQQADSLGWPLVRHPYLHFPDDKGVRDFSFEQFMLGDALMVAPVLDPGVTKMRVYLPKGSWRDGWRDTLYEGPRWVEVETPLGFPGVFVREGQPWSGKLRKVLFGKSN